MSTTTLITLKVQLAKLNIAKVGCGFFTFADGFDRRSKEETAKAGESRIFHHGNRAKISHTEQKTKFVLATEPGWLPSSYGKALNVSYAGHVYNH